MILNTGGRTDTVQYYSEWLLRRFAAENSRLHDPYSPLLLGNLQDTDIIQQGVQKSFLAKGAAYGQERLEL